MSDLEDSMSWRVIWEIDLEADSPEEAAIAAREMQEDAESIATVFTVINSETREEFQVDLLEEVPS